VITLVIATIGTMIGLLVAAGHQPQLPIALLRGTTAQKTTFYLAVRGRRAVAAKTSLSARCGDGSTWAAKWSPTEGRSAHFVTAAGSFSTQESVKLTYAHGVSGSAQFQLQGTVTGRQAHGTIRLQASFFINRAWAYCDSRAIAWSAGSNAA